jgi:hypothetical protein
MVKAQNAGLKKGYDRKLLDLEMAYKEKLERQDLTIAQMLGQQRYL